MEKNKINTILIIGNGFDLAHGLPTTYEDFLEFLAKIKLTKECRDCGQIKKSLDNWTTNSVTTPSPHPIIKKYILDSLNTRVSGNDHYNRNTGKSEFKPIDANIEPNDWDHIYAKNTNKSIQLLYDRIGYNIWFDHFFCKYNSNKMSGLNWIDFEQEIKNIIISLNEANLEIIDINTILKKFQLSEDYSNLILENPYDFPNTSRDVIDFLQKDLDNLIKCLEIYLEDCVKKIPVRKVFLGIFNHDFDRILSFNYTDTFARIYSRPNIFPEYDYIHGKTQLSSKNNNMVLGIDEYLEDTKKDRDTTWLQFKKYYQRIHKKTSCKYTKWLEDIDKNSEKTELYIFGHSLAVTDKDVLRAFIMNDNIRTTVFYHNTETFGQQITNLVQIIGQDNLDKKVRSAHPSLIFKEQENFCRAT